MNQLMYRLEATMKKKIEKTKQDAYTGIYA